MNKIYVALFLIFAQFVFGQSTNIGDAQNARKSSLSNVPPTNVVDNSNKTLDDSTLVIDGSYKDFVEQTKDMDVKHNPLNLIIYRPENKYELNDIRAFIQIFDLNGNEVTYDKSICNATYEWVNWTSDLRKIYKSNPTNFVTVFQRPYQGQIKHYKKKYFISGNMAMHLSLKKGKYIIKFITPISDQNMFTYYDNSKPFDWTSNELLYDTNNPAFVIFLSPRFNDSGYYAGNWELSYNAPKWW